MKTELEKRRFEQVPFSVSVTLTPPLAIRPSIETRSYKVSLDGVGLICQTPPPVSSICTLAFHLATRSGMVVERVVGRVASIRVDDETSLVGVEFGEPLSRQAVPELVRAIEAL